MKRGWACPFRRYGVRTETDLVSPPNPLLATDRQARRTTALPMRPPATSWNLISRAVAGNPQDREQFATRYQGVIRSYFSARWRLPLDHDRVQDGTQEVFVECFKPDGILSQADPSHQGSFHAYLYGTVKRVAANMDRRGARRRKHIHEAADNLDFSPTTDDSLSQIFDAAWTRMLVREAGLLALRHADGHPERTRGLEILQWRHSHGLKTREIAELFGLKSTEISEILRSAKQDFRVAFLTIMSNYHPKLTEAELQRECSELAAAI